MYILKVRFTDNCQSIIIHFILFFFYVKYDFEAFFPQEDFNQAII